MTLRARAARATTFAWTSVTSGALCASCVALLGACAREAPPAATAVAVVAPPPVPPPDVTAVAPPDDLLVFARFTRPTASVKVALDWAALPPFGNEDELVQGMLDGLTESKTPKALAAIVDPALPIDFATTLAPRLGAEPVYVVAMAVRNLDSARATLGASFDLVAADGGVFQVALRSATARPPEAPGKAGDGDGPKPCELAPSAGASAYRLVCGSSAEALRSLAPYLTRTTPRLSLAPDVHLEFHAAPLKGLATLARLQGPAFLGAVLGLNSATDPATSELLAAVVGDVLDYANDLDAMTLDATFEPSQGTMAFRSTFKSTSSLVARLATAHPERVDVPPAAFTRLPGDVDLAAFASGVDEADLARPRELLAAVAREQLKKTKLPEADQRALVDVALASIRSGRGVLAHGVADATTYWLYETDAAGAQPDRLARDAIAALSRPGVAKWLEEALPPGSVLPTWKVVAPLAGLPAGSLHVELTIPEPVESGFSPHGKHPGPPGAKPAATPARAVARHPIVHLVHVVWVPDGSRHWVAMSTSEAVIRAKLASVLGASPASASPPARGVQALKEMRMASGGFFTIRAFLQLARDATPGQLLAGKRIQWDEILRHLPAGGTTPILSTSAALAGAGDDPGGSYELDWTVPAEAVRDAVSLAVQLQGP